MEKKVKKIIQAPQQITLSILELKCDSFYLTDFARANNKKIPFENFEYIFTATFTAIKENHQGRVEITIILNGTDNSVKNQIAELKASALFFIKNFDELVKENGKEGLLISNGLMEICNNLTINAMRGMFVLKLENTIYANTIFPLIDPRALIPQVANQNVKTQ